MGYPHVQNTCVIIHWLAGHIDRGGCPIKSKTVRAYVDPHARRLVDAINVSGMDVQTFACCSGHYHKPGMPYIAFRCRGWKFLRFMLLTLTGLNTVTRGQAHLDLREQRGDVIKGSIRFSMHLSVLPGIDWGPVYTEREKPPKRLVRLWWRELEELAAMIEERRTWPSREIVELSQELWCNRRRGRLPTWAKPPGAAGG